MDSRATSRVGVEVFTGIRYDAIMAPTKVLGDPRSSSLPIILTKAQVSNWDGEKGFGFIKPDAGDKDLPRGCRVVFDSNHTGLPGSKFFTRDYIGVLWDPD